MQKFSGGGVAEKQASLREILYGTLTNQSKFRSEPPPADLPKIITSTPFPVRGHSLFVTSYNGVHISL